jgi:tRNA(Arg) A34 adenosine deaminase TadA
MKTINEYLNDLKEKTGSDYASAKALEIGKSSLSMIRTRGQLGDETAIKLADKLGIDRSEVLIAAAIARSEGEVKAAWQKTAEYKRISTLAIVGGLALGGYAMQRGDMHSMHKMMAENTTDYTLYELTGHCGICAIILAAFIALVVRFSYEKQVAPNPRSHKTPQYEFPLGCRSLDATKSLKLLPAIF